MSELIYKTPNNNYAVYWNTDALWQEIFGCESGWYSIVRIEDNCANSTPIEQEFELSDVFKWLCRRNIISRDEMLDQIRKKCSEDK